MATYIKIATATAGVGGVSNFTFNSIPSTYTDLKVVASIRTNAAATNDICYFRFNGSATAIYSSIWLAGNGSAASSGIGMNDTKVYDAQVDAANATANTFGNLEVYIPNYLSANNKSLSIDAVTENNAASAQAAMVASIWASTAAITSIALTPETGTLFVQYSSATLYGISKS